MTVATPTASRTACQVEENRLGQGASSRLLLAAPALIGLTFRLLV